MQGLPRLPGRREPPAKGMHDGPYLAQTGTPARPAKPFKRTMCCVRQTCTSPQGRAARVPSHERITAAGTCSQLQQHEGCAPLYPPELVPAPILTGGNSQDPRAASHLNGAGSRGKGQGMEINAPASVSSCPLAGLFYSGSLNMYILLHALLQY